ncbi:hypothetical protein DW971_02285 [Veillonella parvula]|nr:hypothetical protein DW971_02285 [Veillonella parvula]
MITAVEIVKALTIKCRELLQCDVNDRDISEGFFRPSFFIEVVDFNNEDIGGIIRGDTLNIYIYYFNEKREIGYLNLLKARESLREMLAMPVNVADGFSITASDIVETINKADMSYITNFDVTIYQNRPEANAPYMEELSVNGELQKSTEQ